MCATAQGEMSATIFYYPGSYVRLVPALRTAPDVRGRALRQRQDRRQHQF